jgi:hypothetical protein
MIVQTKTIFLISRTQISLRSLIFFIPLLIFTSEVFCFSSKISLVDEKLKNEMLNSGSYKTDCPVEPYRLRAISVSYYDFEGKTHDDGEIVIMDAVANQVVNVFEELYALKFPIAKIKRIEHYNSSDDASMADDNSSSFNCRLITNGASTSIHSYGLAIDINPIENPYIKNNQTDPGKLYVLPKEGAKYLNRKNIRPGMTENVVDLFTKHGFRVWGGSWDDPIDWQHFQTPRFIAELLTIMSPDDAKEFFSLYSANTPTVFDNFPDQDATLNVLYKRNPEKFMEILRTNFEKFKHYTQEEAIDFLNKEVLLLTDKEL